MDFVDRVKFFAADISSKLDGCKTEEATKNFLIMPFIQQILGYNVFDPDEVMPEYGANASQHTNYKLDYALFQDEQPAILIECKCYGNNLESGKEWSQLFNYFVATDARIGVLTNGIIYKFYADLEKPNKMDKRPFLRLDLLDLKDRSIKELYKFTKSEFKSVDVIDEARRRYCINRIKAKLQEQVKLPDDEFVRFFFKDSYPDNHFTGQLKEDFIEFTAKALDEFIKEPLKGLLDTPPTIHPIAPPEGDPPQPKVVFTDDERDGYYTVKSILSQIISPTRITYKDTQSYCNVLLDDNCWKPIVRLHFNNPDNKRLEIYSMGEDGSKSSEKISISDVNEIYQYSEQMKSMVAAYESS